MFYSCVHFKELQQWATIGLKKLCEHPRREKTPPNKALCHLPQTFLVKNAPRQDLQVATGKKKKKRFDSGSEVLYLDSLMPPENQAQVLAPPIPYAVYGGRRSSGEVLAHLPAKRIDRAARKTRHTTLLLGHEYECGIAALQQSQN